MCDEIRARELEWSNLHTDAAHGLWEAGLWKIIVMPPLPEEDRADMEDEAEALRLDTSRPARLSASWGRARVPCKFCGNRVAKLA